MDTLFRIGTFEREPGAPFAALVLGEDEGLRAFDVAAASRLLLSRATAGELLNARSLDDCLADWDRSFETLSMLAARILSSGWLDVDGIGTPLQALHALPPVLRPGKLVCHAQNYADHVAEMRRTRFAGDVDLSNDFMGVKAKTWPYAFLKAPSTMVGARDDIILAQGHPQIDWEAEMAVVIGRRAKRVREAHAMNHVAGFAIINDVSCRDNQWRTDRPTLRSDWFAAKSFDSFAPIGPFMLPRQFVPDHMRMGIRLSVNGTQMQNGNTGGLIFSPEEQIAFFSQSMTWHPGDILATGTPGGTGQGLNIFLKPGDVIETRIDGLGSQLNRCVPDEG